MNPKKNRNTFFFNVGTCRKKHGTNLVSKPSNWNSSCALGSFVLPIARRIAVQNCCAMLLSHDFWPLHATTTYNLNVSHSTRFLPVLSNSQISTKSKESKNPCSEFVSLTKPKDDAWCPSFQRAPWISSDGFGNQICPIFPSSSPYIKDMFFELLGLIWKWAQ